MSYITIGGNDYSNYCNQLTVSTEKKYTAQTNAAGDTVIDYIKAKRTIEVGFIQANANDAAIKRLLNDVLSGNAITIGYLNPLTGAVESISCFVSSDKVDYYTIQNNRVQFKPFKVKFVEL